MGVAGAGAGAAVIEESFCKPAMPIFFTMQNL